MLYSEEGDQSIRREYENVDWDVPWSLNFNYSITLAKDYSQQEVNDIITQTAQGNGDFKLTKNWSIRYDLRFDFEENKLAFARLGIVRNLHCWQMEMSWVPIGPRENYFFNIRVTANILSDLKMEKRSL